MERLETITPVFYDGTLPGIYEHGKLYISKEYQTAIHLCACGCGEKTVTPFSSKFPGNWGLIDNNGVVTLEGSIGNSQIPCKSHYLIQQNRIIWLDKLN